MKKIFTLFCSIFVLALFANAQVFPCGTKSVPESSTHRQQALLYNNLRASAVIPIKVHVIRTNAGSTTVSYGNVQSQIALLNQQLSGSGLSFAECGPVEYINNTALYTFEKNVDESNLLGYQTSNVVNVYYASTVYGSQGTLVGGYSFFPWYPSHGNHYIMIGSGSHNDNSTLVHEMGHFFGLYHTHETQQGIEYVNQSNCSWAGDQLCDTPADPNCYTCTNSNCNYTPNGSSCPFTDPLGATYSPPTNNIMSYAYRTSSWSCGTNLSAGQKQRMNTYSQSSRSYLQCSASSIPPNDDCNQAISLTSSNNCNYTSGTVNGATSSGLTINSCSGFTSPTALDVWYSFVAQATTHDVTVQPLNPGSTSVDAVIGIYSSCSNGGFIDCCDPLGGGGALSTCSFGNLSIGTTYYLRIFDYGSIAPQYQEFNICVTHSGAIGQHDFYTSNLVLGSTTYLSGDPISISVEQCTNTPSAASATVALEYTLRTTSGAMIQQLGTDNSGLGNNDACDTETISTTFPSGVPSGPCQICAEANYDLAQPEPNTSNNRVCETVTAGVVTTQYQIVLSASPQIGGTTAGAGTYNSGTSITVVAAPAAGYSFDSWTENGASVSNNPSYSFTITSNRVLQANFISNGTSNFIVQVSSLPVSGGNPTGAGNYSSGTTVVLNANQSAGWNFIDWTENGTQVSTQPSYTFQISSNRTLIANFQQQGQNTYTIQGVANPSNAGSVAGGGNYIGGISASLYAIQNNGWQFLNWMENSTIQSTASSYSFTVNANRTLVANFIPIVTFVSDSLNDANAFRIFPNPNNGNYTIQFSSREYKKVEVFDMLGRILYLKEIKGLETCDIEMKEAPGTYFVKVTDRVGRSSSKPVLIR